MMYCRRGWCCWFISLRTTLVGSGIEFGAELRVAERQQIGTFQENVPVVPLPIIDGAGPWRDGPQGELGRVV